MEKTHLHKTVFVEDIHGNKLNYNDNMLTVNLIYGSYSDMEQKERERVRQIQKEGIWHYDPDSSIRVWISPSMIGKISFHPKEV